MKKIYLIAGILSFLISSCAFDNFDEPTSVIEGRVVYQGEVLGFRHDALNLQLYQPGYELYTAFNMPIDQDGTFSALTFNGTYKLINPSGSNQPWVLRTDTVTFELNGSKTIDYEVMPFFMANNESFSKSGSNMTASCSIDKIVQTASLESATLYISRTEFCSQNFNEGRQEISAANITNMNNVNFSVAIPQRLLDFGYCYVRIGIKSAQASERLYTQVQKVSF